MSVWNQNSKVISFIIIKVILTNLRYLTYIMYVSNFYATNIPIWIQSMIFS